MNTKSASSMSAEAIPTGSAPGSRSTKVSNQSVSPLTHTRNVVQPNHSIVRSFDATVTDLLCALRRHQTELVALGIDHHLERSLLVDDDIAEGERAERADAVALF